MSTGLLYALSVVVVVALVAVLGIYLLAVAQGLKAVVSTLAEVTFGARAVERQLRATPENLRQVNAGLIDAATLLPQLSDELDRRSGRSTRDSAPEGGGRVDDLDGNTPDRDRADPVEVQPAG
jgi:hypothetical protein